MSERQKPQIISQIEEERRQKKQIERSQAEAIEQLPNFKIRMAEIIKARVESPEITEIDMRKCFAMSHSKEKFPTILKANIPSDDGEAIAITIRSTKYPGYKKVWPGISEDGDNILQIDYKIQIQGLDYYFVTKGDKAFLESYANYSNMPRDIHSVIIGHQYQSWPASQIPVTMESLTNFQDVIEEMETRGMDFTGTTPPIYTIKRSLNIPT